MRRRDFLGSVAVAPGDIPFYQPPKFELSLNLKTAKPQSPQVQAFAGRVPASEIFGNV
jgi:hypothetical protein